MTAPETGEGRLTLTLGTVTMQTSGAETSLSDLTGKFFSTVFGACEDEDGLGVSLSEQCQKKSCL
jgi:hypothetical protein